MHILIKNKRLLDSIAWTIFQRYRNIEYDDLRQEAFLKGLQLLKTYDENRSSLSSYLYTNVTDHLKYKCVRLFSYTENKKTRYIEISPAYTETTFSESFDDIILKADINRSPEEVQKCVNFIYNFPKKRGWGINTKITKNEIVKAMEDRKINQPWKVMRITQEFFRNYFK